MKQRPFLHSITVLIILFLIASPAIAQLQPATMRQIESLLEEKASRTAVQQKISSQLLQASREFQGQKMVAGVDLEPANVKADKKGVLQVDINARVTDELIGQIQKIGGKIMYASRQFNSIRAEINVSKVETIAAYKTVKFVRPAVQAITIGGGYPRTGIKPADMAATPKAMGNFRGRKLSFEERARRVSNAVDNYMSHKNFNFSAPPAGLVNAQGDRTHRADEVRARYGYAGQGIRIGVLSDSYNALGAAAGDVAGGELPGLGNPVGNTTPVTVLVDYPGGEDEGRAMLQIVHDIAPKAQLFFATADISEASFADNILALRSAPYNCDIIIDDVIYYDEPVFQDGMVAQAVNAVTGSGALYFSSAGNGGSAVKNTSSAWEGDFNDAGSPVFTGSTKTGTIHNFGTMAAPLNGDIIKTSSGPYILSWSDPMGASANDYDLFLLSSTGVVKAASTDVQDGSQDPFEGFGAPTFATGDRLVVFKVSTAQRRALSIHAFGPSGVSILTVATPGETFGHSAAADAYSVAATPAQAPYLSPTPAGPFPAAFTSTNQVETFTSDGPRRIFYYDDGIPLTPGNFLFGTNGGTVRRKPDITAADGVATTTPLNPFYGTSAAAPHAGAVAALIKSAKPSLTSAQIRTIITSTALDIESPGYDNISGYGIIQAAQAIEAVKPVPMAALELGFVTPTEGSFSNGNGTIDPGELANLIVQLRNFSLLNASNAVATLTTTTPGVSILKGVTSYGNVAAEGNSTNAAEPFKFAVNKSVACGSVINFTITVSYSGGAGTQGFLFSVNAGIRLGGAVSSTLGSPPPVSPGYSAFTGTQTGRLNRNGVAAACGVADAALINTTTGARAFDAYTYTNTSSSTLCITSTLTSVNGIDLYQVAYTDSGYIPATPAVHYLAGAGSSGTPTSFAFTVAPGKKFTVVVHAVTPGAQVGTAYSLGINFNLCAASPACNLVDISNTTIATGATGSPYAQSFSATGGSGSGVFSFQVLGNLPAGLAFSGNTLRGTPTQAGSFAIRVIASDPAGCTPDTNSYTLVIAGNPPASVAATYGTPQSAYPSATFAQALQVTVKDAAGNLLPGVKVVFTAPSTGASGTFASGSLTDTAVSNGNGMAASSAFKANAITGSYVVTASVNGLPTASFNLSNFCPASIVVTTGADAGPGSLREALAYACPGVNISFDQSVKIIQLTSGELPIGRAVNITGPGAGKLTISGNNLWRIFDIAAGATAVVNISGLTLTNGSSDATSFYGGGAMLVTTGMVNLSGCVISNSDASLSTFGEGGAIDNEGGTVSIDRCSFFNNTSLDDGGAITHYSGTMRITNSTISGNASSTLGAGGGIFVNAALTMNNTTVYGNRAQYGGNIYRSANTLTFRNNIIGGGSLIGTGGTGPDISGISFVSADYNLIENITGGTITGVTAHNLTGVRANLLPLANYGGETPVLLPRPNSPVINYGDSLLLTGTDQRGFPRLIGRRADIGPVEANYVATATQGTPQTAMVNRSFLLPLQARITETGLPIAGDTLYFQAPLGGASGVFPGLLPGTAAMSNIFGLATSPVFTANGIPGRYNVTGYLGAEYPTVVFDLTNTTASAAASSQSSADGRALEGIAMSAYPNPVSDKLVVQTGGNAKQLLTVTDVLGRRMVTLSVSGGRHEINTKQWSKGVYILTVIEEGKMKYTTKIVKD